MGLLLLLRAAEAPVAAVEEEEEEEDLAGLAAPFLLPDSSHKPEAHLCDKLAT